MRIVITGGQGTIGRIIYNSFKNEFDIVVVDKKPGVIKEYIKIDLTKDYESFRNILNKEDVLIHLAWDFFEDFPNSNVVSDNKTAAENVYKAAMEVGIKKIIVASSVHADSYSITKEKLLTTANEAIPDTPYGATKLYIEALGRFYALYHKMYIIAIRFGGINEKNEVRFDEDPLYDKVLLYKEDCVDLIRKCIEITYIHENYTSVYAVSNNENRVHSTDNILGWEPRYPLKKYEKNKNILVIAAGGKGERINDYFNRAGFKETKLLYPVNGKALFKRVIDNALISNVDLIYILTKHNSGVVNRFLKDNYRNNKKIRIIFSDHSMSICKEILTIKNDLLEGFIFMDGNILFDAKLLNELMKKKKGKNRTARIVVSPIDNAPTHSIVYTKGDKIMKLCNRVESKAMPNGNNFSKQVSLGLMMFSKEILHYMTKFDFIRDLDILLERVFIESESSIDVFIYNGEWLSVHTEEDLCNIDEKFNIIGKKFATK